MAAIIQVNQAGLPAGTPGVSRQDGLSTGALVTVLSLAHQSTYEVELLWVGLHPHPDTTSVPSLQVAGSNGMSFSPSAGVYGTWRIALTTDRGTRQEDYAEISFAVLQSPTAIRIPAANERSDPSASLVKNGPTYLARASFNAPDGISGSPFEHGTYVSWWRAVADLIYAFNTSGGGGGGNSIVAPGTTALLDLQTGDNPDTVPSPALSLCGALLLNTVPSGAQLSGIQPPTAIDNPGFNPGNPYHLRLINGDANACTIKHESTNSDDANRFHCFTGADVSIAAGGKLDLVYLNGRWQVY